MTAQTLIYCVGAAKAGTSWLFDYLFYHPECHFPTVKELHYWDGVQSGKGGFFRDQLPARIAEIRGRHEVTQEATLRAYQERNMADVQRWYDSFDGTTRNDAMYLEFMGYGQSSAKVVGDFTPAYANLPEPWFEQMIGVAENVKAIFLMREPVDRLWSHFRMDAGSVEGACAKMDAFIDGGEEIVARRSNYRQTLNRLTRSLPRNRIHIEFFERLFSQDALDKICAFLGIIPKAGTFGKQVHRSSDGALDDARRARAQAVLKPQYNFIERFMGGLPAEWTQKMVTA